MSIERLHSDSMIDALVADLGAVRPRRAWHEAAAIGGLIAIELLLFIMLSDLRPDLPAMQAVGFAATVPDADAQVRRIAHFVAGAPAGGGAARELAEFVLRAQNRFESSLGRFDGRTA